MLHFTGQLSHLRAISPAQSFSKRLPDFSPAPLSARFRRQPPFDAAIAAMIFDDFHYADAAPASAVSFSEAAARHYFQMNITLFSPSIIFLIVYFADITSAFRHLRFHAPDAAAELPNIYFHCCFRCRLIIAITLAVSFGFISAARR